MTKAFFHYRDPEASGNADQSDWKNEERGFKRLPVVGEYVTRHETSEWYEVRVIVHCPFEADYEAEVFAVKVDHLEVMRKA